MKKKALTQKQIAANRRNARKSTGPRTPDGKQRVSRNAIKHGLLAQSVVVNTKAAPECRNEFNALLADFVSDLKPVGPVEETLVERIATCYWRLRRAQRFENGAIRARLEPDPETAEALDSLKLRIRAAKPKLEHLQRLERIVKNPEAADQPGDAAFLQSAMPEFMRENEVFFGVAAEMSGTQRQKTHDVVRVAVTLQTSELAQLQEEYEKATARDQHRRARADIAGGMPDHESFLRVIRYETMLDRQFHRALAELRRLRNHRDNAPLGVPAARPDHHHALDPNPNRARTNLVSSSPVSSSLASGSLVSSSLDVPRNSPDAFRSRAAAKPVASVSGQNPGLLQKSTNQPPGGQVDHVDRSDGGGLSPRRQHARHQHPLRESRGQVDRRAASDSFVGEVGVRAGRFTRGKQQPGPGRSRARRIGFPRRIVQRLGAKVVYSNNVRSLSEQSGIKETKDETLVQRPRVRRIRSGGRGRRFRTGRGAVE